MIFGEGSGGFSEFRILKLQVSEFLSLEFLVSEFLRSRALPSQLTIIIVQEAVDLADKNENPREKSVLARPDGDPFYCLFPTSAPPQGSL